MGHVTSKEGHSLERLQKEKKQSFKTLLEARGLFLQEWRPHPINLCLALLSFSFLSSLSSLSSFSLSFFSSTWAQEVTQERMKVSDSHLKNVLKRNNLNLAVGGKLQKISRVQLKLCARYFPDRTLLYCYRRFYKLAEPSIQLSLEERWRRYPGTKDELEEEFTRLFKPESYRGIHEVKERWRGSLGYYDYAKTYYPGLPMDQVFDLVYAALIDRHHRHDIKKWKKFYGPQEDYETLLKKILDDSGQVRPLYRTQEGFQALNEFAREMNPSLSEELIKKNIFALGESFRKELSWSFPRGLEGRGVFCTREVIQFLRGKKA